MIHHPSCMMDAGRLAAGILMLACWVTETLGSLLDAVACTPDSWAGTEVKAPTAYTELRLQAGRHRCACGCPASRTLAPTHPPTEPPAHLLRPPERQAGFPPVPVPVQPDLQGRAGWGAAASASSGIALDQYRPHALHCEGQRTVSQQATRAGGPAS